MGTEMKIDNDNIRAAFLIFICFFISTFILSGLLIIDDIGFETSLKLSILTLTNTVNSNLFDLKMPLIRKQNEGDIIFGLHGANYPDDNFEYPEKIIQLIEGDICLFPSSIFHRTLPFESDDERITLAFDIKPISDGDY